MSASRQKGTRYESLVVEHLHAQGFPHAERRALAGAADKGDVTGTPGLAWECKATKQLELAGFLAEAEVARVNSGAVHGVVVWKRRMKSVGESAVILTLDGYLALLREAGYAAGGAAMPGVPGGSVVGTGTPDGVSTPR